MEENKGIELVDEEKESAALQKEKIKKNRKTGIWLMIILAIAGFSLTYWNRTFNSYKAMTTTVISEGTSTKYERYLKGYLKYSKDGITYLNQQEEVVWTEAYTMSNPKISVSEDYAVLADLDGNHVQLYDSKGRVSEMSMNYPIKNVIAARNGLFCVILEGTEAHFIQLYNAKGTLLAEIKTQIENNGYPISVAISSDGEKLAASFYRVDGIESKCVLSFYHFGEGGKGQSGNLVGTYQFDDLLIPKVAFMKDDTVCAVGDYETLLYHFKQKPKLAHTIPFDREIKSIFLNEKYLGYIVCTTEEEIQKGETEPYQVLLYNRKGKLVHRFGKAELHETVELVNDTIVNYSMNQCMIQQLNGKVIFEEEMAGVIRDVLPTDKRRDFYFVYGESSSRVRLTNKVSLKEEQQ